MTGGILMIFVYRRATCQNLREALRLEWLETNGLGDYASSTLTGCNTRKYHGLFTAALDHPEGRYVLLSTLEESLCAGSSEFLFSRLLLSERTRISPRGAHRRVAKVQIPHRRHDSHP